MLSRGPLSWSRDAGRVWYLDATADKGAVRSAVVILTDREVLIRRFWLQFQYQRVRESIYTGDPLNTVIKRIRFRALKLSQLVRARWDSPRSTVIQLKFRADGKQRVRLNSVAEATEFFDELARCTARNLHRNVETVSAAALLRRRRYLSIYLLVTTLTVYIALTMEWLPQDTFIGGGGIAGIAFTLFTMIVGPVAFIVLGIMAVLGIRLETRELLKSPTNKHILSPRDPFCSQNNADQNASE